MEKKTGLPKVQIRLTKPEEEKWFFEQERKTMYPFLLKKTLSRWKEEEYYVSFVLLAEGKKVGGVSFDIYDFLKKGEGNYIILDTWDFFIIEGWQGKDLGGYMLKEILPLIKDYYLREYGFTVAQVIIESNTAPMFYERIVPQTGFQYVKAEMNLLGDKVTYFFINMEG